MSHFSLRARWVLPIERPPIEGGVVSIADGQISAVGDQPAGEGPLQDLGEVVLMPGLVNTHTHLEFSQHKNPLGHAGMPLPEWISLVIASRRHAKQNANTAISTGLQESVTHGVTTVGDIATTASRLVPEPRPNIISFQEAIGFSAARIESVLADVKKRLQNSRDSTKRQGENAHPAIQGLSPHAPYTVHPQLLERLVDLACQQQMPVAMHLAESPEELELLASASGPFRELLVERSMWDEQAIPLGTKPIDYLKVLSRAPRSLAIHGNYFSTADIDFLATQRERMAVVYCPRTHAYFQHSDYPLQQLFAAGVRVALGTDSRASNPNLCLLDEMRFVASRYPDISPTQILTMGTVAGAKALGLLEKIGSISVGKRADLMAIDCGADDDDPEAAILHSKRAPAKTWIQGQLQ